jgi:uncharacterized protein (DUF2141 family)
VLLASCAQVVAPGGGPRDAAPPRVVKYTPDSAQLNFNSKVVELDFDEYIQLKDANNQLIISPPLEKTPEVKVRNKTLTIDLGDEKLKPNTTYSINFGNALQDINENNAKENFSYIFSTGNFIDSLKVKGKVQNAFDHKAEKGLFAMLYSDMSDSAIYKTQPDYFAKTSDDGSFRINNVREGKYKLVVIKDVNSNYKYDGDAESIGFTDSIIDPAESHNILIDIFQEPAKKIFIKKYMHQSYGKVVLLFNEGSDSLRINNLTNTDKGVQEFIDFSAKRDTLTYWMKNYRKDSIKLQVSNGNQILDTVEFKTIKLEEVLKSTRNPFKLNVISSPSGNQSFDLNQPLRLTFSQPLSSVNIDTVQLKQDTTILRNLSFQLNSRDLNQSVTVTTPNTPEKKEDPENKYGVFAPPTIDSVHLLENTKYHLFLPRATFTDIFGLSNDSMSIDFKTRELKYYGSLKLTVTVPETKANYIIQLLDEKERIIKQHHISKTETINYTYLYPSKYSVKLIYDENNNKKWDAGNYMKHIQPERVLYNAEVITIRSNWDAEISWTIQPANKK